MSDTERLLTGAIIGLFVFRVLKRMLRILGVVSSPEKGADAAEPSDQPTDDHDGTTPSTDADNRTDAPPEHPLAKGGKPPGGKRLAISGADPLPRLPSDPYG
eukprot:1189780-Prorocentrum_minimum.AAC.5